MTALHLSSPRATFRLRRLGQALTALGLLAVVRPASAAVIHVNATCSLADAIEAANTDVAVGGCSAGNDADSIQLQPDSTIVLDSADNAWKGGTGLPLVESIITIDGQGSTIVRDPAAPNFRIFGVDYGGDLTIGRVTLSGGSAVADGMGGGRGGAIYSYYARLTLDECVITGNEGEEFFSAVADRGSEVVVHRTTVAGNGPGTAVGSVFGDLTIHQSAVTDNAGDAVRASISFLHVESSTISSNQGIGIHGEFLEVASSTITGNAEAGILGGNYTFDLQGTIVSGNDGVGGRELEIYGDPVTCEDNVLGHGGDAGVTGFTPSATNIVPTGPLESILDPALAFNGGPTQSHLIRSNSPARDAIASCSPADQRAVSRPRGEACDVGAIELVPDPCPTATASFGCTVNGVPNQACLGTNGNDTIIGTSGPDVIVARAGADVVRGGVGDDILCGGAGNDVLLGQLGNDLLVGSDGNDSISGDRGADILNGGTGVDACTTDADDLSIVTCN